MSEEARICLGLTRRLTALKESVTTDAPREVSLKFKSETKRSELEVLAATEDLKEVASSCVMVADQSQRSTDSKRQFLHDWQLQEGSRLRQKATTIATKERAAAALFSAKKNALLSGTRTDGKGDSPTLQPRKTPEVAFTGDAGASLGTHPTATAAKGPSGTYTAAARAFLGTHPAATTVG